MRYVIEKKTRVQRRAEKKLKRKGSIPFDKAHAQNWGPEDPLKARADRAKRNIERNKESARPNRPPLTLQQRMRGRKEMSKKGNLPVANLTMTTPKAQAKEKSYYSKEHVSSKALLGLYRLTEETSELEKRCVADVMGKAAKGPDGKPVSGARDRLSRAYAICRASLQRSGRTKKGTAELTKKGKGISGAKAKKDDHDTKVSKFEKHVVAARKK